MWEMFCVCVRKRHTHKKEEKSIFVYWLFKLFKRLRLGPSNRRRSYHLLVSDPRPCRIESRGRRLCSAARSYTSTYSSTSCSIRPPTSEWWASFFRCCRTWFDSSALCSVCMRSLDFLLLLTKNNRLVIE